MQKERNSKEPIARKKMSVASSSSFSCIKLGISLPQSSSSSSLSSSGFRFSTSKCTAFTIRCSDGSNLRKPLAPSPPNPPTVAKPVPPSSPPPPSSPSSSSSSSSPAGSTPPKPVAVADDAAKKGNITLEFQRQKAKELQEYFKQKKLDEADQGPFFGFIGKNEISNGRWAMFGFAVGMLTEYATGSDFVQQVQILLSNFGILDLE